MMSKEMLLHDANYHGYKPEIYEKVYQLLRVLKQFMAIPYLEERLALKGGTALNLFYFDKIPRMSVDIDLNYIGHIDRDKMLQERVMINDAIHKILQANGFQLSRSPNYHAGGKMVWRYPSLMGQKANLEIDLNYMYRQPLWPTIHKRPNIKLQDTTHIVRVLDIHEIAAGKLSALFSRKTSRDLFDAHHLLVTQKLNINKLRLAFIIYLSMTTIDVMELTPKIIDYNLTDIRNRLLPVLKQNGLPKKHIALRIWAKTIVNDLQNELGNIVPLKSNELDFISNIRNFGKIMPELITEDKALSLIVANHPAIRWVANK